MHERIRQEPPPDYYAILDVARNANEEQIRQAFRKKARQYHPDLNPNNPGAEEKFKEVNEAYGVLSDAEKRKSYDNQARFNPHSANSTPHNKKNNEWTLFGFDLSSFFEGWGASHNPEFAQAIEQLVALRGLVEKSTSLEQVMDYFKIWFADPQTVEAQKMSLFRNDIPGGVIHITTIYQIFQGIETNRGYIVNLEKLLQDFPQLDADPVAVNLKNLITQFKSQHATSQPFKKAPEPQPPRKKTETATHQPTVEQTTREINLLLQTISGAKTLEAVIAILEPWIKDEKTKIFKNSKIPPFDTFSPEALLQELKKFTDKTYKTLDQSELLRSSSPIAIGLKNLVRQHLEKNSTTPPKSAETPKKPAAKPEAPKPTQNPEDNASSEMKTLREKILIVATLTEAVKLLTDFAKQNQQKTTELICLKPQCAPSTLRITLDLITKGQLEYHVTDFFKQTLSLKTAASPIAKHLLGLAETGKI